jgi:GTP cyclohydrolase I
MKDVQNTPDVRQAPIQKVGIKNLKHPIVVLDMANASQHTIATVNMFVDLPHDFKGTHMSRFVEIIKQCHGNISVQEIGTILHSMIDRFESETAHMELRFPYFIKRTAPVSRAESLMDYDCSFVAALDATNGQRELDLVVEARVPVTTVCPCSREISDYGAHNQRSFITVRTRAKKLVWLEEIIAIAEEEASSPVYPLLKREDEKFVTEQAYDNPKFAEDVVRDVSARLKADPRILWHQVESENFESIHNHSAYAQITSKASD